MKKFLATTAVATLMATAASAATTVDLTTGGDVTSLGTLGSFSSGNVSGTIDPYFAWGGSPTVTQSSGGVGVNGWFDSNAQVDGNIDEALTFTFDRKVRLMSVTYSYFGWGDDADVYVNGSMVANDSTDNPYMFGGQIASSFTIGADGGNDSFRIKSFTVAAVPVPAAGFLLLGGLAGLGLVGRKRKKAA